MIEQLRQIIISGGAADCAVVNRAALEPYMTESGKTRAEELVPGWRAVLCAAYPYYIKTTAENANISRYAWGEDYHKVIGRRLENAAEYIKNRSASAVVLVDSSPIPERMAALLGGIGIRGRNGLVIVPPYGSYIFFGTVLTDSEEVCEALKPAVNIRECGGCGACVNACPTGALSGDKFNRESCLSYISQKKGELSRREMELLRENKCVWGCDACQNACLYNKNLKETEIREFREDLLPELTLKIFEGLSNREFMRRYQDRAFSWRGVNVLKRNLKNL